MKRTTWLRSLLAAIVLATSTAQGATIVSYEFELTTEETGPLGRQTGKATFSYDTAIVPEGGGYVEGVDILRSFSLVFDVGTVVGLPEPLVVTYTTLDYARLAFGIAGTLTGFSFGNSSTNRFSVAYGLILEDHPLAFVNYGSATVGYLQDAEVTYLGDPTAVIVDDDEGGGAPGGGGTTQVPEPGTLALLWFGLAGAIVTRKRRASPAS